VGEAARRGHAERRLADGPLQRFDLGDEALGGFGQIIQRQVDHEQEELVAAVAGDQIARARAGEEQRAEVAENAVAGEMAERVVDRLELVEVEDGQTDGTSFDGSVNLTPRERQVLELVARGYPNKSIAYELRISEHTAKFHVGSLLAKLEAASRAEVVTNATRRGLLTV